MAKSGANELHHTDILAGVSELVGEKLKPEQLSGPLGELRQAERGALLEAGSKMGFHRFRDLMMKPYIRLRLAAKDTK
jgi:hypothetical protein